jgi:RNA polymerase sigma factor (TIGR02999 family)
MGPEFSTAESTNGMHEVTRILTAMDQGDPQAAEKLLPLVYDELRNLAAQRLAQEKPGQTLQATALVHEAYLRLGDREEEPQWQNRRHFFGAAAEAMRRILIEAARRKGRLKHQHDRVRLEFSEADFAIPERSEDLLDLDEALERLTTKDCRAAELVKLRYFAGFTNEEAASLLGISPRKANQIWAYARAWLLEELSEVGQG